MTPSATPSVDVQPSIYQGQFGEFTITEHDRQEVRIYRGGLAVAALAFVAATAIALWQPLNATNLGLLSLLYSVFCLALGVSLLTIHIYMQLLHRVLQGFWLIGVLAAIAIAHLDPDLFILTVYRHPLSILGIGFTFAALTGIFFKEAFCFNRLETKILTPLVPVLLLGHLFGLFPVAIERYLLLAWAFLFAIFAFRKVIQPIPPDIGDKSVFAYLQQSKA
ncbi:MAG: DUF2301 domain-containing membrane protein [Leptolyngbyaceae cyanobacterium bins.349]|nr:DUF2301 domain-containing membrane protein [Leptolyngbyaceae cyanobacterium bins.349]